MTTQEILNKDFSNDKETLQKVLRKVKPLSKVEDITLEKLEKMLFKMQRRYDIEILWMLMSGFASDKGFVYTIDIRNKFKVKSVFGATIYEVLGKAIISVWSDIRKGEIQERKNG